jgi:hypothetical protein
VLEFKEHSRPSKRAVADEVTRDALLPIKIEALQKKVKDLLPKLNVNVDFAWGGTLERAITAFPRLDPYPICRTATPF